MPRNPQKLVFAFKVIIYGFYHGKSIKSPWISPPFGRKIFVIFSKPPNNRKAKLLRATSWRYVVLLQRCPFCLIPGCWLQSSTALKMLSLADRKMHQTKCYPPEIFRIDTQNGHIWRESPFPNHHFGYPAVSFLGCMRWDPTSYIWSYGGPFKWPENAWVS